MIAFYAIAYYRVYIDGASYHPLIVCLGGISKTIAGILMAGWYVRGECSIILVLSGAIPDIYLGYYMAYNVWYKELNCSLVPLVLDGNVKKNE